MRVFRPGVGVGLSGDGEGEAPHFDLKCSYKVATDTGTTLREAAEEGGLDGACL